MGVIASLHPLGGTYCASSSSSALPSSSSSSSTSSSTTDAPSGQRKRPRYSPPLLLPALGNTEPADYHGTRFFGKSGNQIAVMLKQKAPWPCNCSTSNARGKRHHIPACALEKWRFEFKLKHTERSRPEPHLPCIGEVLTRIGAAQGHPDLKCTGTKASGEFTWEE